jgi:hypothetical protein
MDIVPLAGRRRLTSAAAALPVLGNLFEPSSKPNRTVLQDFVQRSQSWSGVRLPVPPRLRWALGVLIPIQIAWATLLVIILNGNNPCDGPVCSIATLNHHTAALLTCALICIAGLAVLSPFTRGLAECNARELATAGIAAGAGGAALLGIVALISAGLIFLLLLATFLLGFTAAS